MKIEVEVSDVKQLGTQLGRSGSEIAGINSDLRREMGRLSLRSQGRAEVDQAYKMIQRALQEVEQGLERYSRGVTKKGEDFKEADGKAPPRDWSKTWSYIKIGISLGLDFVPIVGNAKGVIEALWGRDLITGAKLTWYERTLGVLGAFGKGASKGAKLLRLTNETVGGITKFAKVTSKVVNVVDDGKGLVEGLIGRDLITGEVLSPSQRILAMAGAAGSVNKGAQILGFANEATDASKKMKQMDRLADVVDEGSHKKGKIVDAGEAISDRKQGVEAVMAGTAGGTAATVTMTNKKGGKVADEVAATATTNRKQEQISTQNSTGSNGKSGSTGGSGSGGGSAQIDTHQAKDKSGVVDPIHAGTGHQFMSHAVMKLYGAATWKFEIQYNSGLVQRSELGLAWSHNYAMKLTFGDEKEWDSLEQPHQIITVWWNVGRHNVFVRDQDSVYRGIDSWVVGDELFETEEGYTLRLRQSRERYFFTKSGQLQRHETASGLALQASYDAQGHLMSLEDVSSGRAFQFHYTEQIAEDTYIPQLDSISSDDLLVNAASTSLLTRITADERTVSLEYDRAGWLSAYVDANGHATTFTCDELGHILTMSTGEIIDFSNTYDDEYRIIEQRDAKGIPTSLVYDTTSRPGYTITTIINRMGEVSRYIHDKDQLLVEVSHGEGGVESYLYNEQGQEIEHKYAMGEVERRSYDERGRLIGVQDALGHIRSYSYDERNLLVQEVNAQGNATTYSYDEAERLTSITRPDGASCTLTYHASGQLASYTDYAGEVTTYHYDDDGVVSQVEDAEGRITSFVQDEAGRIACVRDKLGGYIQRKYDSLDQLVQVSDPLGRTWNYTYDAYGQVIKMDAPDGAVTTYTYTPMGQVASVTHPLGQMETYQYDAEDRLVAHKKANGGVTKLSYDRAGRVVQVSDPLDRTMSYTYDTGGRVTGIQDRLGQTVQSLEYDVAGRVTAITNGLGHTVTRRWNELNQIIAQTEADGVQTTYHYDHLSRLQAVVQGGVDTSISLPTSVSDTLSSIRIPAQMGSNKTYQVHDVAQGEASVVRYEQQYDAEHRITSYRDGNGYETKRSYDRTGHLLQEQNASGGTLQYRYDTRGWLAERENARGQTQHYTYDASGQLTTLQDEVSQVELVYDEAGRWIHSKESGQEMHRTYDSMGRVTQQQEVWGHTLGYQYDEMGNLTHLTYPDGKVVEYRYNLAGELTEVKDWAGRLTRYRYDAKGRLIEQHRPNGSKEKRRYNAIGQIISQQDETAQGILLQQFTYQYNETGQLIREQDKQYTYDRFRRLVSGVDQGKITNYQYDRGGNLTALGQQDIEENGVLQGSLTKWSYGADNRITAMNGYPVEMDADGNLVYVTDGEQMGSYEYDSRNRLIQSGRMKYRYNWRNERIECIWRGKVTRYVVDDVGPLSKVLLEMDEAGETIARYVYGLGLIGREDGRSGEYQSYHQDLRGSTTLLTNEQGRVTDRYTYGLYGELVQHEGSTTQPFQYNGQDGVMHDANGLYYMRARYYHTGLKRFLNRDVVKGTVLEGQTLNRYAYVNGDPVSYVDPLGLSKFDAGGTSILALPSGKEGTVARNKLENHEFAQAQEIVSFQGGEFIGADKKSLPGIDGTLDGVPVQLKQYTGSSPSGVLSHSTKAEQKALKAGYSNIELYVDAKGVGKEILLDFAQNGPLSKIPNQGIINKIYVNSADGWIVFN